MVLGRVTSFPSSSDLLCSLCSHRSWYVHMIAIIKNRWQQWWWWWWRWLWWQRWWWWRWWTAVLHLSFIELRELVYKLSIVILFYTLLFWNNQKCFIPKFDCSILHPASPLNSQAQFNPDIFPQNEAKYRTCFRASSAFIRILTLRAFLYHGCTLSIHIFVVCFIPISWLYF